MTEPTPPTPRPQPAPLHPLLLMADWIEEDAAIGRLIEDTPIPRPPGWFRELQAREMQHNAAEETLKQLDPAALRAQAAALAAAEAERDALRAALTPSTETKAAYMGEFHFETEVANPAWNEDTDEEEPEYLIEKAVVPWDTIKQIMAAISARAALRGNS